MKMTDIIERLERATGPSRELDGYIAVALGWRHLELGSDLDKYKDEGSPWMDFGEGWLHPGETESYCDVNLRDKRQSYEDDKNGRWSPPPAYTSSIDAAITLVPEGYDWEMGFYHEEDGPASIVWIAGNSWVEYFHDLPAIAICIAALKARETE